MCLCVIDLFGLD